MIFETVLGYKSSWRILELLSETPTKSVSRKDIKEYTKLGNESVNSALKRFAASDIVIREKEGKKDFYYLNLANDFTKMIIEIIKEERTHLKNIPYDYIIILGEFTRKLLEKTNFSERILLFGSVSKGTARMNSDIDLAIITTKKDIKQELIVTQIIDDINNALGRKIEAHYFTKEEFKLSANRLIKEIKRDGINILAYHKTWIISQ